MQGSKPSWLAGYPSASDWEGSRQGSPEGPRLDQAVATASVTRDTSSLECLDQMPRSFGLITTDLGLVGNFSEKKKARRLNVRIAQIAGTAAEHQDGRRALRGQQT